MALLCARKEMCTSDIQQKLSRHEFSDTEKETIIRQLKAEKYIDEQRYAHSFVHDKSRFNKWGKVKIRYALVKKSIPGEIIDKALAEFPDELFSASLLHILQTKNKTIKYRHTLERRNKLIKFALGRGFEMKDILLCLDKLES